MSDIITHPEGLNEENSADYRDHAFTYYAFTHLVKTAIAAAAILMVAVFCYAVYDQAGLGTIILFVGIVVLGYGIATLGRSARRDLGEKAAAPPPRARSGH